MIYRLKANQKGPWCKCCPKKTVRATHRSSIFNEFVCKDHLPELQERDDAERNMRAKDYETEAENQLRWV